MAVTSRERVRRAAVKLFAAKGFHGTGIRDLAQEAGLSSASLYHYMGTKEDLLAEIMRESLERLLESAKTALDGVPDPPSRIAQLVELHVRTHARQPRQTRVVDNEIHALSTTARREVMRLRDTYEGLWSDTIEQGRRQGVFETTQPGATRIALLEMCNGVARWYSSRGALSLDALAAHYVELALRALACQEGPRLPPGPH